MAKRSSTKRDRAPTRTEKGNAAPVEVNDNRQNGAEGKLASEFEQKQVTWLLHPWIPKALLTLVVGNPCVGKSTFIAALIAHATGKRSLEDFVKASAGRVVFLPGYEEDLEVMTIPRLQSAGCAMDRVRLITDERVSLLRDRERIARTVCAFGASLLVGDPIDSYIDEGFAENDGQAVRPLLEAAAWIARKTGAAVVFARHPGKDRDNVMPGSRAWRAVPRSILQLTTDGSVPPRYLLSHYKDSLGQRTDPRFYSLEGTVGEAPRFTFGDDVERSAEELAKCVAGPTGRYKVMLACRLVRHFFNQEEEPTRVKLGEEARKIGVGEDTLADALRLLGVRSVPPARRGDPWLIMKPAQPWPNWLPEEACQSGSR